MKKNLKWIVLVVLLVALLAAAGGLYNSLKDKVELSNFVAESTATAEPAASAAPEVTAEPAATPVPAPAAPDFTVVDQSGSEVRLSDFRGKPVVVNFWASWCGPCKSEMPDFQKAWEQYGDQVQFMIVNLTDGSRETIETAKAYVEKQGFTFPVYFDVTTSAAMTYGISAIPVTCFFGADGSLKASARGAISMPTLERGLKMIMP